MLSDGAGDITRLLIAVREGDSQASSELANLVYNQLRRMARGHLQRERPNHTLEPTALVNEVYLQLVKQEGRNWQNRSHFFAVAANMMRRFLVDYARGASAQKRGGDHGPPEQLTGDIRARVTNIEEVLAVDAALNRLEQCDSRQCRIVELRYFSGMTEEEVAAILGVSVRTVKRDWNMARSFLHDEMTKTVVK